MAKLARTALIICALAALWWPQLASAGGFIVVPQLLSKKEQRRYPGFIPPQIRVYTPEGAELRTDPWQVGERIPVDEGWYHVEVGNVEAKDNRIKLYVADGQVTVVPTGLVVIVVESEAEQPKDVCPRWTGEMYLYLPTQQEPGPMIQNNLKSPDNKQLGAMQVVAGFYRLQWNRFWTSIEVRAGHIYNVETGLAGPMDASDYGVFREPKKNSRPSMKLCRKRPTRLLSRDYHGSYNQHITQYPFKKRVWEELKVERPEQKRGPWVKLRPQKVKGRIYRGEGSAPLNLWAIPKAAPSAEAPAPPTAPASDGGASEEAK